MPLLLLLLLQLLLPLLLLLLQKVGFEKLLRKLVSSDLPHARSTKALRKSNGKRDSCFFAPFLNYSRRHWCYTQRINHVLASSSSLNVFPVIIPSFPHFSSCRTTGTTRIKRRRRRNEVVVFGCWMLSSFSCCLAKGEKWKVMEEEPKEEKRWWWLCPRVQSFNWAYLISRQIHTQSRKWEEVVGSTRVVVLVAS